MSSISFAGFDAEAKRGGGGRGPVGQVKQAVVRSGVNAALNNSATAYNPPAASSLSDDGARVSRAVAASPPLMLDRRLAPRPPGQLLRAPGPPRTRCQGGSCCASRCGHRVTHVKGQARHTSPAVNTVAKGASIKRKSFFACLH